MKKKFIILFVLIIISSGCTNESNKTNELSKQEYLTQFSSINKKIASLKLDFSDTNSNSKDIQKAINLIDDLIALNGPTYLNRKETRVDTLLKEYRQTILNLSNITNPNKKNDEITRLNEITTSLSAAYNTLSK